MIKLSIKKYIYYLLSLVIISVNTGLQTLSASALTNGDINALLASREWYDPDEGVCSSNTQQQNPSVLTTETPSSLTDPSTSLSSLDELEGHKVPAKFGGLGLEEEAQKSGSKIVLKRNNERLTFSPKDVSDADITYYVTMRWRYVRWAWNGTASTDDFPGKESFNWFNEKTRKLVVTNKKTGKSIVVAALEAGPAPWTGTSEGKGNAPAYWSDYIDGTPDEYNGRVAGLSPAAFEVIEAKQRIGGVPVEGDEFEYGWSSDQSLISGTILENGKVTSGGATTNNDSCNSAITGSGDVTSVAKSLAGKKESGGPNCGPDINDIIQFGFGNTNCSSEQPWCAAFVRYVFDKSGNKLGTDTNSALELKDYFQENHVFYTANQKIKPQPGDLYFKTRDRGGHVGIIVEVKDDGSIVTVDGNLSDQVQMKTHLPNYSSIPNLVGFGRMSAPGSVTEDPGYTPPTPGEYTSSIESES